VANLKQQYDNATKRLEEYDQPDIDQEKIKQTYSLNDKSYEKIKETAKSMDCFVEQ